MAVTSSGHLGKVFKRRGGGSQSRWVDIQERDRVAAVSPLWWVGTRERGKAVAR